MNKQPSYEGLWRKRLAALDKVWPEFLAGETEALHKARVASRRIREALPVVAVDAPAAKVRKLRKKMRRFTRVLGPIRELDVELGMLEKQEAGGEVPHAALTLVRREVAGRRQALGRKLKDDTPVRDIKKLLKKLGKVARSRHHHDAWRGVLAATLMQRAKTLKAALDGAGSLYAPDRIHDVRVAVKKLRYALEIAEDARQGGVKPLLSVLKREQDRLGHLHDLQALLKHVHEAGASHGSEPRLGELAAYSDTLERDCRRLHAEFVEAREALFAGVEEIRRSLVPALITERRHQAHVTHTKRAAPPRAKKRA
jgi:CHAD domain-containing protein